MSRSFVRAKLGIVVASSACACIVAACADAYLGVPDGGAVDASATDTAAPPSVDGAVADTAPPPTEGGADATSDSGTVTFLDDFDRPDGALRPPWDGTNVRNGALSLVDLGAGTASERKLQVSITEPTDGGSSTSTVYRRFPFVLLKGRVTFSMKIDDFVATVPDGGAVDSMHLFAAEFPCAGSITHIVRAGLRKRTGGFAIFTASQYIPGGYRGSSDSALRLTTGRFYQIAVDYDATAPAAGKPIATISVDGMVAASVDGTAETAIAHETSTNFVLGTTSAYGGNWQLVFDELKVVAAP